MKHIILWIALLLAPFAAGVDTQTSSIRPGQPWLDSEGKLINAHGFCLLQHEDTYYWFGSQKIPGKTEEESNEAGVSCYTSKDLLQWQHAGLVLDARSPAMPEELRDAYILDRPKVIYHSNTKRFILYFKLYPPKAQGGKSGKDFAYIGVATAKKPTGPYEYQGKFLGGGSTTGSGDFAIYQETDGSVYHIAVRKPDGTRTDKPLVCGKMSDDGLRPSGEYVPLPGVQNATEAPVLFKRKGKYYLLGSASTGWAPNPARFYVADQLTGPYTALGNPCRGTNPHNQLGAEKTFGGQSTFVFPMPGQEDRWIAMFDINLPQDPVHSGYIWLPLEFDQNDQATIAWQSEWTLPGTLRLPACFSDHMVLQRGQAVPVWGWSAPKTEVRVHFGGQDKSTRSDDKGHWSVSLDALTASALPQPLQITSGGKTIEIADVLVGDVWLCSGQSNMHFTMTRVEHASQEIAAVRHPLIRFFTVGDEFSKEPLTTLRGEWKTVSPATVGSCSAVSYYFARDLQKHTGVPIGLLVSSVGGTRIESWMRTETLVNMTEAAPLLAKWKDVSAGELAGIVATYRAYQYQRDHVHPQALAQAKATGAPLPAAPTMPKTRGHDCPAALHNGMIAPLQPYAIRGAIWYQGESNAGQAAAYEKLLPAMIANWRSVWGRDMPFLFVQLAPHQSIHPSIRETQYHIWRDTPRTAMVVTTDVGDANDIHPTRKQPVGSRLALAARALSYGETVEFSGPVFQEIRIEQHRAIVSFSHRGTGLMSQGETLRGFTIAGADGVYVPATATIVGDTVVVTSEKVPHPTHVRYCWAKVPEGNLFNREGLPAVPFRSDDSKKTMEKK